MLSGHSKFKKIKTLSISLLFIFTLLGLTGCFGSSSTGGLPIESSGFETGGNNIDSGDTGTEIISGTGNDDTDSGDTGLGGPVEIPVTIAKVINNRFDEAKLDEARFE